MPCEYQVLIYDELWNINDSLLGTVANQEYSFFTSSSLVDYAKIPSKILGNIQNIQEQDGKSWGSLTDFEAFAWGLEEPEVAPTGPKPIWFSSRAAGWLTWDWKWRGKAGRCNKLIANI